MTVRLLRLALFAGVVAFAIIAVVSEGSRPVRWSGWDAGILACGVPYVILSLRRPRPRDDLSHVLAGKSRLEWANQADQALARIEKANGGKLPEKLIDAADVDFEAFVSLVEAMTALEPLTGDRVSADLKARARLPE